MIETNKHTDVPYLEALTPALRSYQALATKHGINDIFFDNGGKVLEIALRLDMKILPGRLGADLVDSNGIEYELKTCNLNYRRFQFSTNHHLHPIAIEKYRNRDWLFATYEDIQLKDMYHMKAERLEPLFQKWETKYYEKGTPLNDPKIPLKFVEKNAVKIEW